LPKSLAIETRCQCRQTIAKAPIRRTIGQFPSKNPNVSKR